MDEARRRALKVVTGALGAGVSAAVGIPIAGAVWAPAGIETVVSSGQFLAVFERADRLPEDGSPIAVDVVVPAPRDAWSRLPPTRVGTVFLLREGPSVRAFSTVCPHLGCRVDFRPDDGAFFCPCHDSVFDRRGQVTHGPSPRGLDELDVKLEDGKVLVRWVRYRAGREDRVPV